MTGCGVCGKDRARGYTLCPEHLPSNLEDKGKTKPCRYCGEKSEVLISVANERYVYCDGCNKSTFYGQVGK